MEAAWFTKNRAGGPQGNSQFENTDERGDGVTLLVIEINRRVIVWWLVASLKRKKSAICRTTVPRCGKLRPPYLATPR